MAKMMGWVTSKADHSRHCSFLLALSRISFSRGSQLTCCEVTQTALERGSHGEELRTAGKKLISFDNSHVRGSSWQNSLHPVKLSEDCRGPSQHLLARDSESEPRSFSCFWILDPQKLQVGEGIIHSDWNQNSAELVQHDSLVSVL